MYYQQPEQEYQTQQKKTPKFFNVYNNQQVQHLSAIVSSYIMKFNAIQINNLGKYTMISRLKQFFLHSYDLFFNIIPSIPASQIGIYARFIYSRNRQQWQKMQDLSLLMLLDDNPQVCALVQKIYYDVQVPTTIELVSYFLAIGVPKQLVQQLTNSLRQPSLSAQIMAQSATKIKNHIEVFKLAIKRNDILY